MSFKKFNEMELAMLASIANISEEQMEGIEMEKGDIDLDTMEDYFFVPNYLRKPDASNHAVRRKDSFKKKEEQKKLAHNLGYDLSTEHTKKVKSMLSANHSDKNYFRGSKTKQKNWTIREEMRLMEQEELEQARAVLMEKHNSIIGAIMQDIDTLSMDMKTNDRSIENLEMEYKELEEAMKLVSEKLQNAYLRKNGIQAAKLQKERELDTMSTNLKRERISRFGW